VAREGHLAEPLAYAAVLAGLLAARFVPRRARRSR